MKWKRSKKAQQEAKQKEDCQKVKPISSNSPTKISEKSNESRMKPASGFPMDMTKPIFPTPPGSNDAAKTPGAPFAQPLNAFPENKNGNATYLENKHFCDKSSLPFLEPKNGQVSKSDEDKVQSSDENHISESKKGFEDKSGITLTEINVKGLGQLAHNKRFYVNLNENGCSEGLYRPYVV